MRTEADYNQVTAKLERLRNRGTRYELIATHQNGSIVLAGYCSHGKHNILNMLRQNGEAWAKMLSESDMITFARNGMAVEMGPWSIKFSGRTQREAITQGELPFFKLEVIPC